MDLQGHFLLERGIDEALALQPALAVKGGRYDLYPEMRLAARARAGMAGMTVRLVHDFEPHRVERDSKLFSDPVCNIHDESLFRAGVRLGARPRSVKARRGQNAGNAGLYCPACLAWAASSYCCNAADGH